MYIPKHFACDKGDLIDFIDTWNFATLVTVTADGAMQANHVPFLIDQDDGRLYCHLARQNPQSVLLDGSRCLAIFSGPHAYVSPRWYRGEQVVPTWNFEAVHVDAVIVEVDEARLTMIVERLSKKHEAQFEVPWQMSALPDKTRTAMLHAIVGFRLEITSITGKRKLSQNRSKADQLGVIAGLKKQGDEMSTMIAAHMEQEG